METAELFYDGQNQAVRLPKGCHFPGNEVYIQKIGNAVMLVPKERAWETFIDGLNGFTDDVSDAILAARDENIQSPREEL